MVAASGMRNPTQRAAGWVGSCRSRGPRSNSHQSARRGGVSASTAAGLSSDGSSCSRKVSTSGSRVGRDENDYHIVPISPTRGEMDMQSRKLWFGMAVLVVAAVAAPVAGAAVEDDHHHVVLLQHGEFE